MTQFMDAVSMARARLVGERDLFSISELYHENSRIIAAAPGSAQSRESILIAPAGFKRYVHAERTAAMPSRTDLSVPLSDAILQRRSCRVYSDESLRAAVVADLAFYAIGISERGARRCLPSAGGLYPLELYIVSLNVDGLVPAVYHYDVRAHGLTEVRRENCRPALAAAMFIETAVETAAAVLILSAVFGRSKIKYGERAYRFALIEAGHAMQNLCLAATALGVGACPVGGFVDDAINDLIDVDGVEEAALYAATVGVPG
jgi:SagB-type dehydrogenase family enzyme